MSRVFHFTMKERVQKEKGTVHEAEQWRDNYKKANKRKRKRKRKEKKGRRLPNSTFVYQTVLADCRAARSCEPWRFARYPHSTSWKPRGQLDYYKITKLIRYVTDNQHGLYKLSTQPCRFVASRTVQIVQIVQLQ